MDVEGVVRARRAIKSFVEQPLDDATLRQLFELVRFSPSSFNLQHTRFVVVREKARRAALRAAAYGQKHVEECGAVIIVAGKLMAHEDVERVQQHVPDPAIRARIVKTILGYYKENAQLRRDEAIRSGALSSMTLMLAAQSMGLATCPMIGFDPAKVAEIVRLPDDHVAVMLIVLGKPGPGAPFPTSRLPLEETVRLETLDGPGLR
ncbi:MAG TPA: nitroreductase family protein [Planctomycetota bacterium]|nr:nitroreductase family protein [Planctomycetota bacterium]